MSKKARLAARLPALPKESGKSLLSSTIAGLKHKVGGGFSRTGDPLQLADIKAVTRWYGRAYAYIPDKDVNLFKTNVARRKLMVFGESNTSFRKSVNKDLSGGEDYPILTTALGLGAGFVSAGAGFLWTGFTLAMSLAKDNQPVRVRDGDEAHQLEIVGVRDGKIYHVDQILLVDPFRVKANRPIQQWIIHEERNEMLIE